MLNMNPKMKILVSEDNEADFAFARHILLQISGEFEIDWADSYHSTITALDAKHYDICILDYRLGTYTALDVLYYVRNTPSKAAFIVFTALTDRDIDKHALEQGASDYLNKSRLNIETLEQSIRYATHRKAYEVHQAKYMRERELLLKEIEHRVKNNLEIISGLLSWEGSEAKDPETKAVFQNAQNRIHTMVLIHEKLYQSSETLDQIDFQEYAEDLFRLLLAAYGFDSRDITVKMDMPYHLLDLSKAVPCSLILNELISNSLVHAFAYAQRNKTFCLRMRKYGNMLHLSLEDNGDGGVNTTKKQSGFGLHLVNLLANQIGAKIRICFKNGRHVHLRFAESTI